TGEKSPAAEPGSSHWEASSSLGGWRSSGRSAGRCCAGGSWPCSCCSSPRWPCRSAPRPAAPACSGTTSSSAVAGRATGLGATVDSLFGSLNALVVTLPLLNLASLQRDPRVAFVTSDRPVHLLDAGVTAT